MNRVLSIENEKLTCNNHFCNTKNSKPNTHNGLNLLQKKMQQISQDYQDISSILTLIDGEVHSNIELKQWVESAEKSIHHRRRNA